MERRIEKFEPELDSIISVTETVEILGEGYGGPKGPAEGPVWWHEGGYLLFSDIQNNRRMKYQPGVGVTVDKEKVNHHNGLTRDLQGRLVCCENSRRRVTRWEQDGSYTVIMNSFQGQQLWRPNDIVVKSDGCIYFTDPWTGHAAQQEWDRTYPAVFRVTPDLGTKTLLTSDFVMPNGLAFSPDESVLYIIDSSRKHIRAFNVSPGGLLVKESDRVFVELKGEESGGPDGMKVDVAGNVYCGGPGGIFIMDPSGKKLGRIAHGYSGTTNMAFGGDDWKTLFFTSRNQLGSVRVKIPGVAVPTPAR